MESSSSESEDGDEEVERDEREENKGTNIVTSYGLFARNRTCGLTIPVYCSKQLSYVVQLSSSKRNFMCMYHNDAIVLID